MYTVWVNDSEWPECILADWPISQFLAKYTDMPHVSVYVARKRLIDESSISVDLLPWSASAW